ncbi:MAG: hypothetical protein QOI78_8029, partial [Actinomycetota bacterium]|nr:hypothetical protein [Actinomycetota bacterium]
MRSAPQPDTQQGDEGGVRSVLRTLD